MATPIKSSINICVIGHVDSGKSTTVGNLAYLTGCVDKRRMDKLDDEAKKLGKDTFKFAFVTDKMGAEREKGITICSTLIKLVIGGKLFNVIDCPGHEDFLKNMITGAKQADVGIVIVPIAISEFERAISGGTLRDHIMISGVLGVKKLIVCLNKTDCVPAAEQEARFNEVKEEIVRIIKRSHPDKNPIVIPISGYKGTNLVENGEKFPWFKGYTSTAPGGDKDLVITTLEKALLTIEEPKRPIDLPLILPVVERKKIPGIGAVLVGRVDEGLIKPGMKLRIQPGDISAEVKTVEIHKEPRTEAYAGENCGVSLKSITGGDISQIKRGSVMSDATVAPLSIYEAAYARAIIVEHPKGIKEGYTPVMDIGTDNVPTKFLKFCFKTPAGSREKIPIDSSAVIAKSESVICVLKPQRPTVFSASNKAATLSRFALRDANKVVAIGVIEKTLTKEDLLNEFGIDVTKKPVKGVAGAKKGKAAKAA